MPRRLIAAATLGVAIAGTARAQPAPEPAAPLAAPDATAPAPTGYAPPPRIPAIAPPPEAEPSADDEVGDQGISAQLGLATGGRLTPGGLRVTGHYLYQLAERQWFDGVASFTFGSGEAACFRDRTDELACDTGLAAGAGFEVIASVRHLFAPQGAFRPFARLGAGIGAARFADDDVSGVTFTLHGGGGVRAKVAPSIAVVAEADLGLGFGSFSRDLGFAPQIGLAITGGVEFRLR